MKHLSLKVLNARRIREKLKLSREEFAALCFVNPSTVWRWETQGVPVQGSARALLERLKEDTEK